MITYALTLMAGTVYGFIFGLIPVAGAATALITIYGFLDVFRADPYLLVIFTTAIVVSSTIGDSFSSIMMNVPGAAGSAASMVDGFPMAKKGEGARALSAAISTSVLNGALFGVLVFAFLPFYTKIVLSFAIPEMLAFLILASLSVVFVNTEYWFRGIIALGMGIFLGLVGQTSVGDPRFTFGWYYLRDGIQIVPIMSGILAFPELLDAYRHKFEMVKISMHVANTQIRQGLTDSITYWRDGLRGGVIGSLIGLLPGIGGNIVDWIAYGQTVAANKNEEIPFGQGNIKGVIGCEGANNAQKASAYVPTVLFGIPAAPFEAIILSLFIMVGMELGTPTMLNDLKFFNVLFGSYAAALIASTGISFVVLRWLIVVLNIPFRYYFFGILGLLIWSSAQYTGYWEDYMMLGLCCASGVVCKYLKLSRAALIIGFVLSGRIESISTQYVSIYEWYDIFCRPISLTLLVAALVLVVYGIFFNKSKISYV